MPNRASFLVVALAALGLAACTDSPSDGGVGEVPRSGPTDEPTRPSSAATPQLRVEQVAGGLQHGWDIGFSK